MKLLKTCALLIAATILTGCASGYRMINPEKLKYTPNSNADQIGFEYKYDLLNFRYHIKEKKFGVQLVSVKLTNNTAKDLVFDQDIKITYVNGEQLVLMDREQVFSLLKQDPAYYLIYLTFGLVGDINLLDTREPYAPAPLFFGAGLAGINIAWASIANARFDKELVKYNLSGIVIPKGATVYGLVGIRGSSMQLLKVKEL